jgi:molybdate transport system substrate-binding protein
VIAPPPVLDALSKAGRLAGDRASLGRVGVGVAIRTGAPKPEIGSEAALKAAVLGADAVVFNRASTGQYVEGLLQRLGIADQVAAKVVRVADGAAVFKRLAEGRGGEIGFGAITEIVQEKGHGVELVGPLPSGSQNYTAYAAVPTATAEPGPAAEFMAYLASPEGRRRLAESGVEPVA